MEDRRAEIDNSGLETMEFEPDFKSSVIQANRPTQKVKFFQGVTLELLERTINEFLEGRSLVNIQYQTAYVNNNGIFHNVMIHYLEED